MDRYTPVIPVDNGLPKGIFKKEEIAAVLCGGMDAFGGVPLTQCVGRSFLMNTGAKAYYHGGGWWTFSGYSSDKSDIKDVAKVLGFVI